ncbi:MULTISPECIES: hypothetical protein [Staphylococcus]|uniref:hypothetical protein n=1 Tax=Staphylococcus TaxID=1279 RepID=UPI0011A36117|nr:MULTISPECIES: hypothetical protein [Staphylococcus]MBM6207525.1 hypothetical protein [Staphylococcus epidermidis]MBM6214585.1 hypothetical protein [Staphylococcus epidermidis]MBM6216843.1 hypothetical protein [Staphylococcus epidermidis]MCG1081220.1 hypothetical protein [Staphylococcus epidermidis]MCG1653289.1 hypothetical protein [Staphylococcus epidermidis]
MSNIQRPRYYDKRVDELTSAQEIFNYLMFQRFKYQKYEMDLLTDEKLKDELYQARIIEDEVLRQQFEISQKDS